MLDTDHLSIVCKRTLNLSVNGFGICKRPSIHIDGWPYEWAKYMLSWWAVVDWDRVKSQDNTPQVELGRLENPELMTSSPWNAHETIYRPISGFDATKVDCAREFVQCVGIPPGAPWHPRLTMSDRRDHARKMFGHDSEGGDIDNHSNGFFNGRWATLR